MSGKPRNGVIQHEQILLQKKDLKDKGLSGDGYTFIRNALGGVVKDTKFANSLEKQLSGIVCELFGKMNDKASGVYDKLKTGMADSGGLGGLLDKGKTALASAV